MTEPVSAQTILDTAAGLIERQGVEAFTMRGLAEELGWPPRRSTGMSAVATNSSTAWSTDCSARWHICPSTVTRRWNVLRLLPARNAGS